MGIPKTPLPGSRASHFASSSGFPNCTPYVAFSVSISNSENPSIHLSCHLDSCLINRHHLTHGNHKPHTLLKLYTKSRLLTPSSLTNNSQELSHIHAMEHLKDLHIANSDTNTININNSLYLQEEPRYMQNLESFGMDCPKYDHSSASFMPCPPLDSTSYLLQSQNQNLQSPHGYPSEHGASLLFPTHPYDVEGSGTLNLSLGQFPNEVFSHSHAGDMAQVACYMQPLHLSEFEEKKLHAKAARFNRKMARQMSAGLQMNKFASCPSSSLPTSSSRALRTLGKQSTPKNNNNDEEDLYTFSTQDNTKLRVLLQKVLTSTDVGAHGRIILPKREAEDSLPTLTSKEGILVVIKEVYSNQEWQMRYRFWANHKGRMYVLDQFGNFVNHNRLETGDCLTLYEDKCKNLYFSIKKAKNPAPMPSSEQNNTHSTYINTPFTSEATEEEDFSLKILVEELKHTEHHDANNLMTLYTDGASSFPNREQEVLITRHLIRDENLLCVLAT